MKTPHFLLIIVAVAALAAGAGWYVGSSQQSEEVNLSEESAATTTPLVQIPVPEPEEEQRLPDLNGLTIMIPGSEQTAEVMRSETENGGDALYSGTFGDDETGFVAVIDNRLIALDDNMFAVPFAVSYNGSGTFSYLGLLSADSAAQILHVDSYLLGDRIRILDVTADEDSGLITVAILDRHAEQPMTDDPGVDASFIFQPSAEKLDLQSRYYNVMPDEVAISAVAEEDGVTVTGTAPEAWFFEGDFPIELLNANQESITSGFVTRTTPLDMENPSREPVSFGGALDDTQLAEGEAYYLRLERDNVSDNRSLDAFAIIQI